MVRPPQQRYKRRRCRRLISSFEDDYQGEYKDEEDYAYEIVEQCYKLPEFAKTYFDYSAFARDLFMTDYWMEDGFVFRCA